MEKRCISEGFRPGGISQTCRQITANYTTTAKASASVSYIHCIILPNFLQFTGESLVIFPNFYHSGHLLFRQEQLENNIHFVHI
jgi:hypothetical protein